MRGLGLHSRRALQRGFTLIEMLIVVALIAGLAATIVAGSGMFSSARLRGAATLIMSGVRLGISRANSTGRATRMVFDLDAKTVSLEETSGRMLIDKSDTSDTAAGAESVTSAERDAVKEAQGILDGPKVPRARFSPVAAFVGAEGDQPARELGQGVRFLAVQTEHDEEARVDGRAYLYFWPGGSTERAVIQLAREGDSDGLSVLVSGLTGRARIERGLIPFEQRAADENFGVREEE